MSPDNSRTDGLPLLLDPQDGWSVAVPVNMLAELLRSGKRGRQGSGRRRLERQLAAVLDRLEDIDDREQVDAFEAALARGDEELVPSSVAERLLAGEHPVKVWRKYRGLTQAALAAEAGLNKVHLSQIETRRRVGTLYTLRRLAAALGVDIEDLLDRTDP